MELENVQGAVRMLGDEYYRVFLILFTTDYYISWERMKTVNRWLPSTVSQLGGTK